ncbi:MAG: hypothetical protein PVI43_01015 [Candidatus Bathyarchaeota archaeon]
MPEEDLEALFEQAQPIGAEVPVPKPEEDLASEFEAATPIEELSQPEERDWIDELKRQIGLTSRAAAEGTAEVASVFTDPLAEVMNLALPDDMKIAMIKPAVNKLLTDAGVPEPETATERIVQQASKALVGAGAFTGAAQQIAKQAPTMAKGLEVITEKSGQQLAGAAGAGAGQKIAEESGAGPGVQLASTLAGGMIGAGAAKIPSMLKPDTTAIKETIKTNPTSAEIAEYKVVGNEVVKDKPAIESIKQGFQPSVISAVKTASNKDKLNMKKMLHVLKEGKEDAVYAAKNRPTDVVGDSLNERVNFLFNANRKAGTAIDNAAKKLQGKTVNITDPLNSLKTKLDDMGVAIGRNEDGDILVDISKSDIRLEGTSKKILQNILRSVDESGGDAYKLHKLKRLIDTQVSYGKGKQAIGKSTESVLKDFRRNINETLGELSPAYKAQNTKYSETLDVLNDIQKAVGTSINMKSPNVPKSFGTSLRGLLSNNKSRVNMMDSITKADNVATKYGLKSNDDILRQVIFANEIDRMFGAAAPTSFKGQIEEATMKGLDIARRNMLETAIDLTAKGMEKARGINEENAIKAIETLLKEK